MKHEQLSSGQVQPKNYNKKHKMKKAILSLLSALVVSSAHMGHCQIVPPVPSTNNPPPTNLPTAGSLATPTGGGAGFIGTSGTEYVLLNTLPTSPDPTQALPSWATIDSGGLSIDTNGFIVDTNGDVPSDNTGMEAGNILGVVIGGTNLFTLTRGEFYVILTNSSSELANTRFEVKIMRNTNDFAYVFSQELALAEYQTNMAGITLTPITGTSNTNLYDLAVQFPPCIITTNRVISIRTEPLDTDLPFAQLQWLTATGTNATYTTDTTLTNFTQVATVPAIQLWAQNVTGVGMGVNTCLTPNQLNLFAIPGTIIQASTSPNGGFTDYLLPDEMGFGDFDTTQSSNAFFALRIDTTP